MSGGGGGYKLSIGFEPIAPTSGAWRKETMASSLFRRITVSRSVPLVRTVLVGKPRSPGQAQPGGFTRRDADRITEHTWKNYDDLIPDAPPQKTAGGRRNVRLGVLTLAHYRALRAEVDDPRYAIELTRAFCWAGYEKSILLSRAMTRLATRDPRRQMELQLRLGLRYPFSRPDYDWTVRPDPDAFAVDFHRCPVHDYFRAQGEEALELFRNTWCRLDFPLAEAMVRGGRYERPHTLSHGDEVCDMRWIVDRG